MAGTASVLANRLNLRMKPATVDVLAILARAHVLEITQRIDGGENGLPERARLYGRRRIRLRPRRILLELSL